MGALFKMAWRNLGRPLTGLRYQPFNLRIWRNAFTQIKGLLKALVTGP